MPQIKQYTWLLSLSIMLQSSVNKSYQPINGLESSGLCTAIDYIIHHQEITKTLGVHEVPMFYASVRVFTPGVVIDSCISNLGKWKVQYLDELRPSLNTGFHRDIVVYGRSDLDPFEYHVYLASHENYKNRQTTYFVRFMETNSDSLSLIGFAEYYD